MRSLTTAVLLLPLLFLTGKPIAAEDFCASLFVPEGYGLECVEAEDGTTVVQPVDGVFRHLSNLHIREMDPDSEQLAFDDPLAWLTQQAGFDVEGLQTRLHSLSNDPDNPIGNDALTGMIDMAVEALGEFRETTLSVCDEATERDDNRYELACAYELGPLSYFTWSRIISIDGKRYFVQATTMNAKRLDHFKAIANSFLQ